MATLRGCVPGLIPSFSLLIWRAGAGGGGHPVLPNAPCFMGPVTPDVNDLLKFIRPLHEGTLVFVASYDDPATK